MNTPDWAAKMAAAKRVKTITIQDVDGNDVQVAMKVPVGLDAVEYVRDIRGIFRTANAVRQRRKDLGIDVRPRSDFDLDEAYTQHLASAVQAEQDLHEDDKQALLDLEDEGADTVRVFVMRWLPRLCDDLAQLDEDGLANVVKLTGGSNGPLVEGLMDMVTATADATSDEGLDDLPF